MYSPKIKLRLNRVLFCLFFISVSLIFANKSSAATIYFNDVFKATGTSYVEQTNSLTNIQAINGSGFKFTSLNPADVVFRVTGNNVAGVLSFVNSSGVKQEVTGQISRQDKSGSTTKALYFFTSSGEAYLLVLPGVTSYSSNTNVSTDSSPFLDDMNALLSSQNSSPKILINDISVQSTVGYAVFTVSLSSAANANISFTPTLTSVTAILNTDFTNAMQYYNGSAWVNITSSVQIAQGGTSIQIRVPILSTSSTVSKTFNLNTGAISGGNVLNNDGAYGICTINYTPLLTISGTLSAFTSCSGVASSSQTVTVSGINLTNNIILTAPTGYEISTSGSSYSSTVTLTQSGGTVSSTTIYVRLTSAATNGASGTISVTSTGATSQTFSITAATVNALPTITLGATSSVSSSATSFSLPYTATSGSPNQYSITRTTPALANFVDVANASLSGSPITVTIPASPANTYGFNITVKNSTTGCVSAAVPFTQTVTGPLITVSGSLTTFTTCAGVASGTQTVTVSGTNLGANIVLTAPTGYELSADASSYSSTITLTQSGGTVNSTTIYVRLTSSATNGVSGTISVTSTNASPQTFATGTAVVNVIPTITLAATTNVSTSATSFSLPFTATSGSPNQYSITTGATALAGFATVTNASFNTSPITVTIPASAANTYNFNLTVKNSTTGCESTVVPFTQTITQPTITTSGTLSAFTSCSGVASSTQTVTVSGINLTNNIIVTAPTGYELSTSGSSYSSTVTLMQSGGNVSSTTIYVRLSAAATNGASGTISVTSTGATSQTFSINAATVNALPTITLGATSSVSSSATSFSLPYSATTDNPDLYSISVSTPALANFVDVANASLSGSPITVTIPASLANTYGFNITVKNSTTGCVSAAVPFTQTVTGPLITVSGSLTTFTTCAGVASGTQTVTVSGTNLGANIVLTAPTGYELSADASSYSSTITLTQSGGNVSSTTIYVRLSAAATNGASGTISVTSTGAASQTFATGTAVVNVIPTITLAATTNVSTSATSFSLPFTATSGSPNQYSITTGATALAGFATVTNASFNTSPITVTIPASAANTYNFNLTVKNSTTGCESAVVPFTQTIYSASSTITVTGLTTYTYNGSAQGPNTNTSTGSTGAVTYSYAGTGSTTYGPSATRPTNVGTYQVIATLASDANYSGATSAPFAFIINDAPSVISINRVENTPTNLSTLHFVVTFSKGITGFDVGDLTLVNTGTVSTTSMVVSTATSSTYTVTVSGISGNGTLGLDLKSSGTGIVDSYGAGITNGITGQVYTIDKVTIAPSFNTPASNDNFVGTSLGVSVNIPEANFANSIRLTFAGLSNTVIVTLNNGNGVITGNLNLNNLSASSIVASSSQSTLPSDIYTVTLSYQDYLGNSVASASINNFKVNYNLPSTIVVTGLTTYTYNGSAQGPATNTKTGSTGAVTYSYAGTGSTSYGPSATAPTNVGTYQVIATLAADANYSGATSAAYAFTITAASSTITVTGATTYTYNASPQGPATNTKTGSTGAVTYSYVGTGSTTYGPSATAPTNTGTYQAIATLAADANYSGATSAAYAFTITAASSTITVTGLTTYTYSGSAQGPNTNTKTGSTGAVTYSYAGTGSTSYGPSTTAPTNVGAYEVIATLASDANYSGATSAPYAFTITAASSTITVTGATTYTFNNTPQGPATNTKTGSTGAVTYSYAGTGSTTYGPSATAPTNTGTYQVIATLAADANYSGATSAAYAFTITAASSTITVTGATTYVYNASPQGPNTNTKTGSTGAVTYSYAGTGSTSYGPSTTAPTNVGAYEVIATLASDANYSGATSAAYAFTITAASSTITVTGATTYTYNASPQGPATNIKTGSTGAVTYSYVGTGSTTYGPSATAPTNTGTYQVIATLAADANYSGATSAAYAFTITAASSTITVTGATTYTYNASPQGPATNTKTGSTGAVTYSYVGTGSTTYGPSATPPTGVGTYQVIATLAADANYSGATSAAYAFTITAASSTITVTGATTFTYSGSAQGPATNTKTGSTGAVTYSYVGTGSTSYGPSATAPTNTGTYQVIATLAADANYSGATSAAYAFTITAASSTITVTGATTYTYNASPQGPATNTKTGSTGAVTYSYVGTGSTSYGPSATPPTNAGTYTVVATLSADASFSAATSAAYAFTINKLAPVISLADIVKTMGDPNFSIAATSTSGGAITYSIANVNIATVASSTVTLKGVGVTTITVTQVETENYLSATTTATLTVKPAAPTTTPGSYVIGNPSNPSNTNILITPNPGATLNFYTVATGGTASSVQPLPTLVGVYTFYVSQTINGIEGPRVPYTVTILPSISVKSATYIVGANNNPANISSLVIGIANGSKPRWCNAAGASCSDVAPALPSVPGVYIWCVKAVDIATGLESSGCIYDTVTILAPASVMGVQKKASALTLQPDGTYTMDFTFTLTNYLSVGLDSIQLIDNLSNVFVSPSTYKVLGVSTTGTLVASTTFNGSSITNLLLPSSKIGAGKSETVVLKIQISPQSYAGTLTNSATGIALSPYGTFGSPASTTFVIPAIDLFIADVLTPNQDGKNDQWIILKPAHKQLKVEIVNRWGQRVYTNSDYQNNFVGRGTGSFIGQDLADGTYFYFIEVVDKNTGGKEFRKGYLTLKR